MILRRALPYSNTGHSLVIPRHSTVYGAHSELVEYPSRAVCSRHHNGFGGIYISALTGNTRVPAGSPTSAFTFVPFSLRSCTCSHPHRAGWSIAARLPRYAAFYNYFESWNLVFTDIELESEAQLLNAVPPPIRRHQAQ